MRTRDPAEKGIIIEETKGAKEDTKQN